jgi:hypothetical protein
MASTVENQDSKIRWGAEQRLEFIEFRLFWEGGVNRSDITGRFGVSVPQASNDLAMYREKAPANIRYDSSEKRYLATPEFSPKFLKPSADRYLVQLKALSDRVIALHDTWIGDCPESDSMPIPHRRVDLGILKGLVGAIRANRSVDILHRSMNSSREEEMWRRITPHAFGHDGFRWHVRAFCHIDEIFKDFVLSRCLGVGELHEPGAKPQEDTAWYSFFDVVLEPNPSLSDRERKTIALDYEMPNDQVTVSVRRALLYYFNKRLRLDEAKLFDDPAVAPIVVVNREEFMRAFPTTKAHSDLLT